MRNRPEEINIKLLRVYSLCLMSSGKGRFIWTDLHYLCVCVHVCLCFLYALPLRCQFHFELLICQRSFLPSESERASPALSSQAVEVIEEDSGVPQDARLQSQRTEAFLSLARFSDAQYQSIDKYMNSSEFENKQALLEKAKKEVDLMRERKVTSNRSHYPTLK